MTPPLALPHISPTATATVAPHRTAQHRAVTAQATTVTDPYHRRLAALLTPCTALVGTNQIKSLLLNSLLRRALTRIPPPPMLRQPKGRQSG